VDHSRWATFDCYGTLVDWNEGIRTQLARLLTPGPADRLLERYHQIEPSIQIENPTLSYREVMARVLAALALAEGVTLADEERDALANSLPEWPIFPDAPAELGAAHGRGWKLAILSNSDRDLIEASMRALGAPFELAIVASEVGSYKPAHGHWAAFYSATGADPERHVHVAQSHFHDIVPATELGLPTLWINRLGEAGDPQPTRQLPDLVGLGDVLDELVSGG
jgi:2-haloacid dehalogenase